METKGKIREIVKNERLAISKTYFEEISGEICRKIISTDLFKEAKVVYGYASANNEVNIEEVLLEALKMEKCLAMPRVNGEEMFFHKIKALEELERGYFDILEPPTCNEIIEVNENALMLVPGVAFSPNGYRIGYGKGFYDRYLKKNSLITTVGIGYDFQLEKDWEPEEFDVPLDVIITEKREVLVYDKT